MNPPDLILHHYDGSPFSEKLRLMLGAKKLPWRSVRVPAIMPKPDVLALTGGYRKTPIVQMGADIYCDTALVTTLFDRLAPQPCLLPPDQPLAPLIAQWADSILFWTVIPYTMQPAGMANIFKGAPPEAMQAFAADRKPFTAGLRRQTVADATANLDSYLMWLASMLDDGRPWLLGDALTAADFAVAHCGWYVRRGGPEVAARMEALKPFSKWLDRMLAIGHGSFTPMGSGEAIEVAAAAAAAGRYADTKVQGGLGFLPGQAVTVAAIDYGTDPVAGTLVGLSNSEVVVARQDARAGLVHVHFPRRGFQVKQEQAA